MEILQLIFLCHVIHLLLIVSSNAEKIIIDADPGADDAIAILQLLRAEQLEPKKYQIIAVTTTYGNTEEKNVVKNILKILTVANRTDIPVYRGAKRPLLGKFSSDNHFGRDGFGDAKFKQKITAKVDESMHAAVALSHLTEKYQGDVSIFVLGPTTNIALAASLDEKFISRVKKFYVSGSSVTGWGNYKANVEFNFGADPESNFILLSSTNASQLILFPWETAFFANLSKDWRINILGKMKSPYIKFINVIESRSFIKTKDYTIPDAMLVAAILWPQIITQSLETYVHAVIDGSARGSVLVEYPRSYKPTTKSPNVKIIQSIDVELFKEAMIYFLTCEVIAC